MSFLEPQARFRRTISAYHGNIYQILPKIKFKKTKKTFIIPPERKKIHLSFTTKGPILPALRHLGQLLLPAAAFFLLPYFLPTSFHGFSLSARRTRDALALLSLGYWELGTGGVAAFSVSWTIQTRLCAAKVIEEDLDIFTVLFLCFFWGGRLNFGGGFFVSFVDSCGNGLIDDLLRLKERI